MGDIGFTPFALVLHDDKRRQEVSTISPRLTTRQRL